MDYVLLNYIFYEHEYSLLILYYSLLIYMLVTVFLLQIIAGRVLP